MVLMGIADFAHDVADRRNVTDVHAA